MKSKKSQSAMSRLLIGIIILIVSAILIIYLAITFWAPVKEKTKLKPKALIMIPSLSLTANLFKKTKKAAVSPLVYTIIAVIMTIIIIIVAVTLLRGVFNVGKLPV